MDFLPEDQAWIADQLGHLASGPEPGVRQRILSAVSRAPAGSGPPLPPRFRGGRERRSPIALVLTFTLTVPLVTWNIAHSQSYHTTLSPSVMSLVGGVDEGLAAQISFDGSKNQYVFNQDGKKTPSPAPTDTYSLTVGADKSNPASTYSVDLPMNPAQGFTYYDNHLQLSFTLIPQFPMGPAQESAGRIIYPFENGGEAIYTVKNNGLREDLIFTQPTTTANFTYQLKLPDTLQAQSKDGVIGIYSADPSLFGNITFGSSDDQMKVMDARTKSAKTNLVFAIAPPVVNDIHATSIDANYSLTGDQLQVSATNLSTLAYPITLDPSVVVNSTAGFATGNNEDTNIDFPANKINRGGLTGGVIGAWTANPTSLPAVTEEATSVAYNGYVYEIGGCGTPCPTAVVDYAPLNADGTIGSWTATSSLPAATDQATSVAYNGYVYEIGGFTTLTVATVDYAPINADGTLGAWTATTSLPVVTYQATSVVYNGYVYEIGGFEGAATTVVDYAPVNADGTLGAWTATTSLPVATWQATSVAYNGYVYEIGGFTTAFTAVVDYAPINSSGTIGAWTATTSLPAAIGHATSVAYNGYLYEMGGFNAGSKAVVDYAQINANGTIGAWTATTSLPAINEAATSVAYNGYIYEIGGCPGVSCGTPTTVVDYAQIQPAGTIGSGNPTAWSTTTALPGVKQAGTFYFPQQATSVAYNGFVYEIGGSYGAAGLQALVEFAPINANGTLGAWTATTSLPLATYFATSVVYNGYLYEIGGCNTLLCPTNGITTVDYVAINANGTLATPWQATTALPAGTYFATSVVYNGYVYEIGGSAPGTVATVDYVAINANGTLATPWQATTSLLAATNQATSVVYNGYLYEIGGNVNTTVDYAPINANGTIGAWTATTSLPAPIAQATSVAYNGYVYEIGGNSSGTITAVVDYAPINVNGTLGAWTATTSLPAGTDWATSVVYNGYLYELGGANSAGVGQSTVYYGLINNGGPGTLGSWTATTSLPVANYSATSVAYNGYVYEIGGCGTPCTTAAVDYVAINANGTLATPWQATTSLPAANWNATSVAYNGYIYEIGGNTGSVTAVVDYALICTGGNSGVGGCGATAGTIGTWTATTSLPTGTDGATSVAYNGYVYEIGGFTTAATAVVDYAPINADGTIGTWTATTSLPAATYSATSVAYDGYVYEIGGLDSAGLHVAVVDYAPINADGTIGTWTATTSLPAATQIATSVVYNGYVYEIGGLSAAATAIVDRAPINSNGTIGDWNATTSLPAGTYQATSVAYNGYVYEIGGFTTAATAVVDYAPLNVIPRTAHYSKLFNEGAAGGLTGWNATTSLPSPNYDAALVAYNGYLYEIGGSNDGANPITTVDYVNIGADGTIGAWASTSSLPVATMELTGMAYSGYLYAIGGCKASGCAVANVTAVVDYAKVNADGTLGTWTATTSLPTATDSAASVAYNGYLYEIGGFTSAATAVVDYVAINANGTLGSPWNATTSLPTATYDDTAVVYNGYLYEVGGYTSAPTAVVDYVAINANGTLGSPWNATTSLPVATYSATSVAYNGYLYEIGGCTSTCPTAAVDYSPFNANGTIGAWTPTNSLPLVAGDGQALAGSVAYNGYVYEVGGFDGFLNDAGVSYAPIQYPIPIGTLLSITYTGTLPGGTASISYETAGSNGLLTASATAPTIAQGNCISGSIQYIWVRITLDDSQAGAVFADSVGTNNANVTSFTINYMSHPPANQRLHGGKFFSNNVLGPLDTCHP